MNTVLVAGGAGFIGSHLCDALLSKGSTVICVDNFITGDKNNIAHLKGSKSFELIEADISVPETNKIIESKYNKIDEIYNLASPASPVDYVLYPIETLMVGSMGTKNLLDMALKHKAKILVASTSEVYGDPLEHPQKETYWGNVNPVGVRSCYDEAKRFMEALTSAYKRKYALRIRISRIFNTYGPRMRLNDGRVVPNFIPQAIKGEDITVYGDGSQTRSFCYVSDMVDGLISLMNSEVDTPINIGNPEERSILDFAKAVVRMTGSNSKIVNFPLPSDDPKRRKPDISKAKELLKWSPRVSFEDGIYKTVEYFKNSN